MRVPVQNGVAEETRECGMTLWMSEWVSVWMFLFSCLNKTIVKTTSCAAACSWTPILTNRRRIWIHKHSQQLFPLVVSNMLAWAWVAAMMSSNWERVFFFLFSNFFFFQGRADRLKSLQHSGWSQARKGEEETRVCVRGQVREGKEKKGGEKEDGEGDRKREDVRHAASMQVYYEKRCLRRQASEDGSSSASDALHHIRLSARELYSRTHRHCKSSVATRGVYVTDLLFSNLRAAINIQRLKKKKKKNERYLIVMPGRVTTEINRSDKSPELPLRVTSHTRFSQVDWLVNRSALTSGHMTAGRRC